MYKMSNEVPNCKRNNLRKFEIDKTIYSNLPLKS